MYCRSKSKLRDQKGPRHFGMNNVAICSSPIVSMASSEIQNGVNRLEFQNPSFDRFIVVVM